MPRDANACYKAKSVAGKVNGLAMQMLHPLGRVVLIGPCPTCREAEILLIYKS